MAWKNESRRHALASKGIKTGTKGKPTPIARVDDETNELLEEMKGCSECGAMRMQGLTPAVCQYHLDEQQRIYNKKEKPSVYPIYKIQQGDSKLNNKQKSEAIKELKEQGYPYHVYFETPFQLRFIGVNNMNDAKKVYKEIMTKNKDLYGCVVSIKNTK